MIRVCLYDDSLLLVLDNNKIKYDYKFLLQFKGYTVITNNRDVEMAVIMQVVQVSIV